MRKAPVAEDSRDCDDQQRPTFSVIIATCNRAHLVGRAIRSVLAQTYQAFEIIVVDDASTDETQSAVEAFHDPRISYLKRETNGGVAAATNDGIRKAKGKYISFLGDDDEFLPEFLEETYRHFESGLQGIGFMWCGIQVVKAGSEGMMVERNELPSIAKSESREGAYLSFLRSTPLGSGCGLTLRRACFDSVDLFDETLRTAVDREFLLRLVRQFEFDVIPEVLVRVHSHAGPKVNVFGPEKARAYECMIQGNIQTLREHRGLWATWHYKTGWIFYHSGDKVRGRVYMMQALRRCPWHLKSWLGLLLFELLGRRGPHLHRLFNRAAKTLRLPRRQRSRRRSEPDRYPTRRPVG
jgi:glycosyltransferase involved in cell wall biosynthesis